jgi:hypothetical protein
MISDELLIKFQELQGIFFKIFKVMGSIFNQL